MLSDFELSFIFSLTPEEALSNLVAALICGVLIAFLYKITYKGINYSGSNVMAIIMLSMITALVIMVIGNNLARAFGLVGAMSIIRFRTAVKDTQDIMFIFFALAAGLAAGAGMHLIAYIGTIFIGVVVYVITLLNFASTVRKEYLVQLVFEARHEPGKDLTDILSRYCSSFKLVNLKTFGEEQDQLAEYSYYIVLKSKRRSLEFTTKLKSLQNLKTVNVFFDET